MDEMLKRILSLFLLAIFSLQTVGMTVMHHVCISHHSDRITALNGISAEAENGCCCLDSHDSCNPFLPEPDMLSIDREKCCQEKSSYLKFDFTAGVTGNLVLIPVFAAVVYSIFDPTHQADTLTRIISHPFFRYYSPPLTGVGFLLSIHQIKIPGDFHC